MLELGVVVVTYNRLEKLKKALWSYEQQSCLPNYILVIDNCSSDGTDAFLENWRKEEGEIKRISFSLESNTGGSGGFYEGLKMACSMDAEWIWVSDDDAYPDTDCFEKINCYIKNQQFKDISAVCTSVWMKDKIDTWHRRRVKKRFCIGFMEERVKEHEYQKDAFYLDLFSYVGTVVKKSVVKEVGLPRKEFFIAYDDSEHSMRVRSKGRIVCLPEAKVIHDTDEKPEVITWKKYYGLRNKIYSYKIHFGKRQAILQAGYFLIKNFGNATLRRMTHAAVSDGLSGRLGVDCVYKPGWKEN